MNAVRTTQNVTGPTLTIDLPPEFAGQQVEVEVRVVPKTQPWGEDLRRRDGDTETGRQPTAADKLALFEAWIQSHPPCPVIADDSRESIYAGRGE